MKFSQKHIAKSLVAWVSGVGIFTFLFSSMLGVIGSLITALLISLAAIYACRLNDWTRGIR